MKICFLCLIALFLWSCSSSCEDCEEAVHDDIVGLKNESGVDVEMSFFTDGDTLNAIVKDQERFYYSDTSREKNVPSNNQGLYLFGKPIGVKMVFLTESAKCLDFVGDVENKDIDIRSIESYQKIEDDVAMPGVRLQLYQYIITASLIDRAKECN